MMAFFFYFFQETNGGNNFHLRLNGVLSLKRDVYHSMGCYVVMQGILMERQGSRRSAYLYLSEISLLPI